LSAKRLKTGAQVAFRLTDAVCPDFDRIVSEVGPELIVSGEIALLSRRGTEAEHFAVISVHGIASPLVVPVHKLKVYDGGKAVPKGEEMYGKRKDMGVRHVEALIEGTKWAAWFARQKKKDDLADALLQGLHCLFREDC